MKINFKSQIKIIIQKIKKNIFYIIDIIFYF